MGGGGGGGGEGGELHCGVLDVDQKHFGTSDGGVGGGRRWSFDVVFSWSEFGGRGNAQTDTHTKKPIFGNIFRCASISRNYSGR